MDYTPEQQELIRRMIEISARIDQLGAAYAAQPVAPDPVAALTTAIRHANESGALCRQHGQLFREFLDTL